MTDIVITAEPLTLRQLRDIWLHEVHITISDNAHERLTVSNLRIGKVLESGDQVYGVNTGFGKLGRRCVT